MRTFFNLRHLGAFLARRSVFSLPYYREAELARLANLFAHVDLERWNGMRVLEVGAGVGHIGDALAHLKFDVTSTDGRLRHVRQMQRRGRNAFVLDLDQAGIDGIGTYDLVVAFGVLYHLSEPERFLLSCGRQARVLLLESAVCDSAGAVAPRVVEAKGWRGQDQALNEFGCRPSPSWVEQTCRAAGFDVIRDISSPLANWEIGVFDWEPRNDGSTKRGKANLRKMWILEKSNPGPPSHA